MNYLMNFSNKFVLAIKLVFGQVQSINDLIVKSDEENLEKLLEKPEDKVKFQKAIDALKDSSSQDIVLNGKKVTISI